MPEHGGAPEELQPDALPAEFVEPVKGLPADGVDVTRGAQPVAEVVNALFAPEEGVPGQRRSGAERRFNPQIPAERSTAGAISCLGLNL